MTKAIKYSKNAIINSIIEDYANKAEQASIDFSYNVISPPLLAMSNEDLTNLLLQILSNVFLLKSNSVSLNINVFLGKMQIECKSFHLSQPSINNDQVEEILVRNYGMLKTKFYDNKFILQIVFPI